MIISLTLALSKLNLSWIKVPEGDTSILVGDSAYSCNKFIHTGFSQKNEKSDIKSQTKVTKEA